MPLVFMTENPESTRKLVITKDSESITLAVLNAVETFNDEHRQELIDRSASWSDFSGQAMSHVTSQHRSGCVDYFGLGMIITDVPGEGDSLFSYGGKSTFDLKGGMSGAEEIVDYSIIDIMIDKEGKPLSWSSRFAGTKIGKIDYSFRFRSQRGLNNGVVIFMPFKESSLDDLRIEVLAGKRAAIGETPDLEIPWKDVPQDGLWFKQWFWKVTPEIENLTVKAGETIEVPVKLTWAADNSDCARSTVLKIDSDCGYLPYRRMTVDDKGKGKILVSALGLKAEDKIGVKFNTDNYSGIGKIIVEVV